MTAYACWAASCGVPRRCWVRPPISATRAFQTHTRSARDLVQRLHRLGRRKGDEAAGALRVAYGRLINVASKTRRQAARVAAPRLRTEPAARRLADHIEPILPRLDQVLAQTERRVLHGQAVPAGDKILSRFEPHTQIIVRHKAGKPVEFGRKVWLEEVE